VWSCTIWSSMRSVMIASMIRGGIFRVSWLLQTLYRLLFRNFSIHIMRFETRQPTSPSMKIWWTIFGFMRGTTSSQTLKITPFELI
jgi:hypothetical protein